MITFFGAILIGLSLGLMGSGGSLITVPVLTYLLEHDSKVAIAESLAIVGSISLVSVIPFARRKQVDWRSVAFFGVPGMAGTYFGAVIAQYVSGGFQLALFAVVTLMAAVLMLRPATRIKSESPVAIDEDEQDKKHALPLVIIEGLVVGALTGLVGVGGGFMIVPALVILSGLPMRKAIGTSVAIIALKSGSGLYKYLETLQESEAKFDWIVVMWFVLFGVVGSVIGQRLGQYVNQRLMKKIFGLLLIIVAAIVLVRELPGLFRSVETEANAGEIMTSTTLSQEGREERTNLLIVQGDSGAWEEVASVEDWQRRRTSILAAMKTIMGPVPSDERRVDLDVRVLEEVDTDSYVRRLITYQSESGSRVPAYLCVPKKEGAEKMPAVLCLHPTDDRVGHQVVLGLGGRPNRQYAHELAERGYVTISPAYPLLANYQPDLDGLGYESGTMKAIWDNMRAIDLLESMDEVDKERIGAIGHSLGGHNAIYSAAIDERIKVIVSSCGLDSYVDYKDGDIRGWTSTRYMPKLLEYRDKLTSVPFDFHELVGALAPRPCMIIAPYGDANFKWESVDRIAAAAIEVYRLFDAESSLRVVHPDCDHDFPDPWRQKAYAFIDGTLKLEP